MIRTCRSRSYSRIPPGFVSPSLSLLSSSPPPHYHPCLSHSCPHLMFFLFQIHHLSVVMSSFCFLPCNARVILIYSTSSPPLRAGSMPIISSLPPTSFMLTSSLFISPRCTCACLWFTLSPHSPGLIVILQSSLLQPLVHVLFIGLVPTIVVFHTTHARVSIFVTKPRTVNLRFRCILSRFAFYAQPTTFHVLRVSFPPLPPKLTPSYIQPTTHTTPY